MVRVLSKVFKVNENADPRSTGGRGGVSGNADPRSTGGRGELAETPT